jgi:murein DD-endopeptidase MepM/ murein hydrolase activator NlpD
MLLSPVKSPAKITQAFGMTDYAKTGAYGKDNGKARPHNGIDFGIPTGTPVYAVFDGIVRTKDDGKSGYGLHIKIRSETKALESVYGHLYKLGVKDGQKVNIGDVIGYSGSTGMSTGPHLHWGVRRLVRSTADLFAWGVENYNTSDYGYFDQSKATILWTGTL